ncbi:DUF4129 domain-containing protein [Ilumatobacter sp.]|jgi:hypothetical protein|uniref:DUF4129 domain-containing protein n=1 Tax=Ilumatobacter sp. TaxID=1967498 RepID=UPI0030B4334A|tara:strand:- start:1151 stop:1894 length:744 start_codon:yes stop_codon:yes gene_type:complete
MSRRVVWIVVASALTSLLFAWVSTSGGVNLWGEVQWDPTPAERGPIDFDGSFDSTDSPMRFDETDVSSFELPEWIESILQVLVVVVAFVAMIALVIMGWRNRPRLRWRRRPAGAEDFEVLPDVAATVVHEAAAQRAALVGGMPRNAIVQCWLRLEGDVAAAGLLRNSADTSAEFTERVLGRYSVDSEAIQELAALYREARFSQHSLDESARQLALDALDRLHQALRMASTEQVGAEAPASPLRGVSR